MMRIAIIAEAFDAVSATLPLGSVGYEAELTAQGERLIWIERPWLRKLDAQRRPSESLSDVILRLVKFEVGSTMDWRSLKPSVSAMGPSLPTS